MAITRTSVIDENFKSFVEARGAQTPRGDLDQPVISGTALSARLAIQMFEAQIESRLLDIIARRLKAEGHCYYTIGSSGHEGNAAVAAATRFNDTAFLHYRSGAFFLTRAKRHPGPHGPLDMLLGMVASRDEPIAGGRHKVFGSVPLHIPPQTSTIASHLPKALGYAIALDRRAKLEGRREDRITLCSFGDASSNHATAAGTFNATCWASFQHIPAPVLYICEDNGLGISVRTPRGWVAANFQNREGIKYFYGDGLSLPSAYDAAKAAADYVRETRKPAFLHLNVVRLLGHAGSDVEQLYRTKAEITEAESLDPLHQTAGLLIDHGWMSPEEVLALYQDTEIRLSALAEEAKRREKISTDKEVMTPLFYHSDDTVAAHCHGASNEDRLQCFGETLPENADRRRHMAIQINRALTDLLLAHDNAIIFGEDVSKKGGVYHITASLFEKFGIGRVFNTLLDETTILGFAIGAAQVGLLPIPEIQYLAYLMNAIDQLRGEAGSLQFFSKGQYSNPMVIRIAGLAYQKGFGGHFHNDHGIAAIREIPGILIACPSRGDDAVGMLRALTSAAVSMGRVCIFLEPIALYMQKDLYEEKDGLWQTQYPEPGRHIPLGEVGVYGDGKDLCIATYANGLWMSLRVAKRLEAKGIRCRVIDLRWLQPLPIEALVPHVEVTGKLLVVDECRKSSGIADTVIADILERLGHQAEYGRVTAQDTYIPLGDAANLVIVQEADIESAALSMCASPASKEKSK